MTDILNLPDWKAIATRQEGAEFVIEAEYTVHPKACQKCGVLDRLYRHGAKVTSYRDSPIRGAQVNILANVKRYRCRDCGETFVQPLGSIQPGMRMTVRCVEYIKTQCLRDTFVRIAEHIGCDDKTVRMIADVKKPPAPPDRKRLMLPAERDKIAAACGFDGTVTTTTHQVAVAMLLALETAMRAGEMLGLTWADVHLQAQYVSLPKTKNGDQRDVPLSTRAVELLTLMVGVDKVSVFTITSASLDALFRKVRDACKIDNLHFHDTRATALTNLSKRLDVLELARMVGHRDLKSLMIYYRPTATTLAAKLG